MPGREAQLFGDDDLAGGGHDGFLEGPFYGHREIIMEFGKRRRAERLVAAPADKNGADQRLAGVADDDRAARSADQQIEAIERQRIFSRGAPPTGRPRMTVARACDPMPRFFCPVSG